MSLSVANVLLQITGDSDGARRELEAVSRDLALFGRETAEAEADIDTTAATAHLDELKAKLAEFSADDHSTEVNIQIAKAQADLAVLQAELDRIDGENVKVDVDVRRGIVEKIASLTGQIERLGQKTEQVSSGGLSKFVSSIFDADIGVGRWSASLESILQIGPAVVAVVIALVGQIVAIVASAASAAGGIGALATAFVAALVPGVLLAVGAIAQFKKDSETAGTAAFALSGNVTDLVNVFKKATAGGADAVFKGISGAIRDLAPLVQALGPAFTRLGRAGGDAFRLLGKQFSSPAWRKFFTFTTDSLAKLTPLFARSFGAFAAILRNIATAAMPFLISGFRLLAKGLEAIAGKTSDIRSLRDSIGGMVESLGAWGHLLGGIVKLAGAFVSAFAPIGDKIVGALGDGAENLAKWLSSSEGLRKVKQFFQDTGPLASEVGKLILNVGLALVQLGQFVAPALTPMVRGLNDVFGVLNKVLSWLNDHVSPGFRALLGAVGAVVVGFGKFKIAGSAIAAVAGGMIGALAALGGAFDDVGKAIGSGFSAAFSAVVSTARDIAHGAVEAVRGLIGAATDAGHGIFDGVRSGFNAARGATVSVARAIARAAVGAVHTFVGAAKGAGQAVMGAVRAGMNFQRSAIIAVARAIAQGAVAAVRAHVAAAGAASTAIMNAVRGGFNAARGSVVDAARAVAQASVDAVRAAVGAAAAAGRAIGNSVASGIRGAIGVVTSAAQAIWDAAKSIIEAPLHIHIDVPNVNIPGFASGVRSRSESGVALVGEQGPELRFIPQGADVFTASETRRILRALANGVARPISGGAPAPALAGAGTGTVIGEQSFHFSTPGTGNPDPRVAMAQAALFERQKGRRR